VILPDPVKREERKRRTAGERRGLGIQMRRRGVVWDRGGEVGTELGGLYRGKGWERRKRMT
jgi:hypothetical protein